MLRRRWQILLATGTLTLYGLSWWKNRKSYKGKSILWTSVKSLTDIGLIILAAARLPTLLIAWVSFWITKPIKNVPTRITIGILIGLGLEFLAEGFLEALLLLGVLAIDSVTGKHGFLGLVEKYEKEEEAKKAA